MPIVKDVPGVGAVEFADEAAALKFEQQAGFGGGAGGPFEQTLGQRAERAFDVGREALVESAGPALRFASPTAGILEALGLMDPGDVEKIGSGIQRMERLLKENGNPPMEISVTNFFSIKFLPRIEEEFLKSMSQRQVQLFEIVKTRKRITKFYHLENFEV